MKKLALGKLLKEVKSCNRCEQVLPLEPRPIVQVGRKAKILIVGQAPSIKVHESGIPWNDASGVRLREWLGISPEYFYDKNKVAILPVGFCYPGTGAQGDLPPRKECFPLWHNKIVSLLPEVKLTLLLGTYAQRAYLKKRLKGNLTETVREWREYLPHYIPLPHPSPLNNIWLKKNSWFQEEVLPELRKIVSRHM